MHLALVDGLSPDDAVWALVDSKRGTVRQIAGSFEDWAPSAATEGERALNLVGDEVALNSVKLRAPRNPGGRIFGVGLNYLDHLERLGRSAPAHPIAYIKPDSTLIDPEGAVGYPAVTRRLDFEVELVAVVARALVDDVPASACLLGYTIGNDISARDAGSKLDMLDLFTQKALDGTAPVGPWITTLDMFGGAGQPAVNIEMFINDELRQRGNSRDMIFSIDELLNFVDARVRLRAGDLIFTGSMAGVGLEDGRFLKRGDRLEARIQHIGSLHHTIGIGRKLSASRAVGRLGLPEDIEAEDCK